MKKLLIALTLMSVTAHAGVTVIREEDPVGGAPKRMGGPVSVEAMRPIARDQFIAKPSAMLLYKNLVLVKRPYNRDGESAIQAFDINTSKLIWTLNRVQMMEIHDDVFMITGPVGRGFGIYVQSINLETGLPHWQVPLPDL